MVSGIADNFAFSYFLMLRSSCLLLALVLFSCSPRPLLVQERRPQQYVIRQDAPADSLLSAMLLPYKRGVDTQMQAVIGHTDIPLTKAQPESTLGNFLTDAMLAAAQRIDPKVVAAVGNYGGIRLPYIAPGPITRGRMYELMPFDNTLAIVEVPGSVLQQFCDAMAARKGWPVSGLSFTIKDKKAADVLIAGVPLNPVFVYPLALSDYNARGGDHCDFLAPLRKRHTGIFIRDAMIEYISALEREGKPLHPALQNRVRYAE
jgi:2',3'-cyclic-nucleotide 2'-phosphodiesterase (5'-nucleotidase family)